jgi:hypothetical protein
LEDPVIDASANAVAFLASAILCTSVFALAAWSKREFLAGFIAAVACAVTLALAGLNLANGQSLDRYQIGVAAVPGLLATACLFGVDFIGLPEWLSVRIGVGLKDPRARFYEKLRVPWMQVGVEMDAGRAEPHGRYGHLRKASSLADRIADLEAPTSDWARLRDDVVNCQRAWIGLARKNRDPDRWPARPHAYPMLTARYQELANGVLAERGLTLEEYGSRTKLVRRLVWVTAAAVAVPGLLVTSSPDFLGNQWLWLDLCGLYICTVSMLALASAELARLAGGS